MTSSPPFSSTPSDDWLPLLDGILDDALDLIEHVWPELAATAGTLLEPDITIWLFSRLQSSLADRPYALAIDDPGDIEPFLVPQRGMGKTAKKVDLVLRLRANPARFYPIEAKVLVGAALGGYQPARQANEYVTNGIVRFVSGTYSSPSMKAAMLGYVLRGPEHDCARLVQKEIASTSTPTATTLTRRKPHRYFSEHPTGKANVRIEHLWLVAK